MARPINIELQNFILRTVSDRPNEVAVLASKKFNVSRATISKYVKRLIAEGLLIPSGNTRARRYFLKPIVEVIERIDVNPDTEEDEVWLRYVRPKIGSIRPNIRDICQYGFTEILNNVIDHSRSKVCFFWYSQDYAKIKMGICDEGVGIFEKIKTDFNLVDARHALLELSKGKLTSDRTKHTGEGIFFTSRMFDSFSINSYGLFYTRKRAELDWLVDVDDSEDQVHGTNVLMEIDLESETLMQQVFEMHVDDNDRFAKTHVAVTLANIGDEMFVSRSQAKRVMARVDKFSEVVLDFQGVESIGQAFADEIFRVFQSDHPSMKILAINSNRAVEAMIKHARANAAESTDSDEPQLF